MKCESGKMSYNYLSMLFYTACDFKDVCATKVMYSLSLKSCFRRPMTQRKGHDSDNQYKNVRSVKTNCKNKYI